MTDSPVGTYDSLNVSFTHHSSSGISQLYTSAPVCLNANHRVSLSERRGLTSNITIPHGAQMPRKSTSYAADIEEELPIYNEFLREVDALNRKFATLLTQCAGRTAAGKMRTDDNRPEEETP